jgi:hypothetical protein
MFDKPNISIHSLNGFLAPLAGEPLASTTTGPFECLIPSLASFSSGDSTTLFPEERISASDSAAESVELHQPSGRVGRCEPLSVRSDRASAVKGEVGKVTSFSFLALSCGGESRARGDRILRDGLAITVP